MNSLLSRKLESGRLYFDGGLGSELSKYSLSQEEQQCSALVSLRHPAELQAIHEQYLTAGCDVITANTFTANPIKAEQYHFSLEDAILRSVQIAKQAISVSGKKEKLVALDIGPSGKLLEPFGFCSFDEIYAYYQQIAAYGEKAGADFILFETFSDIYELKAGILAAKESTALPILATMTLEKNLHTLTGSSPEIIAAVLESLGVAAYGFNCSLGPVEMKEPTLQLLNCAHQPVLLQPNAGLPKTKDGTVTYDINATQFSNIMAELAQAGVVGLGGCCGTTPEHIHAVVEKTHSIKHAVCSAKTEPCICSYQQIVSFQSLDELSLYTMDINAETIDIKAVASGDYSELSDLAFDALDEESDAIVLKIDCKFEKPEVTMAGILLEIQSMVKLPLILQTSQPELIQTYNKKYNGKGLVL